MNFDAVSRLKRALSAMEKDGCAADEELIGIFRITRQWLEHKTIRSTFPTITLYCNWLLHPAIDRDESVYVLIENVDRIFTRDKDEGSLETDLLAINRALCLGPLRAEMVRLFSGAGLRTFLFTSFSNWRVIAAAILTDLVDKPIIFQLPPKGAVAKEVYQRIAARRIARGHSPERMIRRIHISDRRMEKPERGRPPGFYYNIQLNIQSEKNYSLLTGLLEGTETRGDFSED